MKKAGSICEGRRSDTGGCRTLQTFFVGALAEAKQRDLSDSFVLSGTSAKFSITFDLAWKVMKDILVEYYAMTGLLRVRRVKCSKHPIKQN